jgi:NAD dependent epimerase/dehydratase
MNMSHPNTKVLLTGADGFIGSHLAEALVLRGYKVKAFVQYNSLGSWGWIDRVPTAIKNELEIVSGDIRDAYGVKKAMTGVDAVLHLAALISIPHSYNSPESYVDTNIKGTLNVLQAARELGTSKIVHTSTSEVYGTAKFVPITESHPLQGQSPYSASKIGADQLAFSFFSAFELPVVTIRPFNTYGPRQSARAVIPTIISQIASKSETIKLGSVDTTRDFTYILDTVAGFIAALESKEGSGEVINLGSNYEVSIFDTVKTISEIMNTDCRVELSDERMRPKDSEVQRLWADNSKAKQILGWSPSKSGIEGFREGLTQTVSWFLNPENLEFYKPGIYNT